MSEYAALLARIFGGNPLKESDKYLREKYHDPNSGFGTKAAATLGMIPVSIARGMGQAFTAPTRAMSDPTFDPVSEAQNMAGIITLGGLGMSRGGLGPRGDVLGMGVGSKAPIKAYHGSPHDFDAFDSSKIGTGEGAQAYGHGLYFAENPEVARSYKGAGLAHYVGGDRQDAALSLLDKAGGDKKLAIEMAHQNMTQTTKYSEGKMWQDVVNNFDELVSRPKARMYEVNIHADQDKFLDWDRPLSEQAPEVGQVLKDMWGKSQKSFSALDPNGNPTAGQVAHIYSQHRGGNAAAVSDEFSKAGIPGIKYLDQGSRGSGTGTNNYVVFDPKMIEILKKYGMLAPTLAAGFMGQKDDGT